MIIFGLGVSKGKVCARCISFDEYLEGNIHEPIILVVEFLPPYISALSTNVVGIIAEDGGLLSHAACIAREFGIPCVVRVENAIELLDGKAVFIDGEKGAISC